MDLSRYSTEELKEMLGNSQPKTDLSSYSTEDLFKMAGIERPKHVAKQITPEQRAETRRQGAELLKDLGINTSGLGVAGSGALGFGKGVLGGAERLAGGATLGISDWVGDKLGTGVKERRQELEELNPAIKGLNIGADLLGGVATGGGLYKGVAKGLGAIPKVGKAAQYLAPTVTGAVSGGAYSGFENDSLDSAKIGALMGGAIGAGSDLVLRGLGKLWSAASKVKNTPRGFENAVGTKEGARTLNRAVRESDKIAEEVYAKAPETLETLNARAMDKLDDAVRGGVDVKGTMASAKKAYGDFIDTNKSNKVIGQPLKENKSYDIYNAVRAKTKDGTGIITDTRSMMDWSRNGKGVYHEVDVFYPENGKTITYNGKDIKGYLGNSNTSPTNNSVNVSDLGITGLTDNQKSWLNQAWTAGKKNTLEKAGSLGHLDEMSKELNKMVQASRLPNATGVGTVSTPETVALQGLKDKVDNVIEKAGLQSIKAQYRQAKTLEDSFNRGLKFKPIEIKTRDLTFKTPEEKSAFAQGLIEQIKMNPETRNIAGKARDLRGALRKVLGDNAKGVFNEIDNINKSYKNVEKILGNAERKLSVPEPINGRIGLLREFVESPGSVIGGIADFARRWGTAKSSERAAKYLLNPNLKIGKSPYDAMRPYLPTLGSILETNVMKGEQ